MKRLLALAALLTAMTSNASAEESATLEIPDFSVTEAAKMLVPASNTPKLGATVTLAEHQPALIGKIFVLSATKLSSPFTATIAGFDWAVQPENLLVMMEGFSGGDLASLPKSSRVYCDIAGIEPRKTGPNATSAEKKERKSRFEKEAALCFIDKGGDGDFDAVFMTGMRQQGDRHMIAIPKIAYAEIKDIPLPGGQIEFRFHHQNFMHTPRFYTEAFLFGSPIYLQAVSMPEEIGGAPVPVTMAPNIEMKSMPDTINFGTAQITVLSVDGKNKTAEVRINKLWDQSPVSITRIVY